MNKAIKTTNWRYIFNTRRLFIYAVSCGVAGLIIILAAILPQVQSTLHVYGELQETQSTLNRLKKKALQLEQAPQSLLISQSSLINQALPSKKPLLEFLTSLSLVASQSQIRITDISLSPGKIATESAQPKARPNSGSRDKKATASRNPYEELEVELTITGQLAGVNSFLQNVEKMAPFTTVTEMTLNEEFKPSIGTPTEPAFVAEMKVITYFYSQAIVATLESPLPEMDAQQQEVLQALSSYTLPQLELQQTIQGGGLQDLFGVNSIQDLEAN